ncbi:unnamed protein product, partial [Laminaria digitata]
RIWQERTRDGRNVVHRTQRAQDEADRRARVRGTGRGGGSGDGGSGGGSTPGGRCREAEISKDDGRVADAWRAEEEARRRREREDDDGCKRGEGGGGLDAPDGGGKGRTLPDAEDEALLVPR